jgi:predicted Fe-Mo cluster-binding NifX family protein
MKIAVSSSGKNLQSLVEPRFGRCPYFVVVDTDSMMNQIVPNMAVGSAHGAGIAAAQLIVSKGVKAVLTGNVGPNAYSALSASSIEIVTGVTGTVEDAVKRYEKGELKPTGKPTVGGHFGQRGMRRSDRGITGRQRR